MPPAKISLVTALKKLPLLCGLDENALDFLGQRVARRHFKSGEAVFTEGYPCGGLYLIEEGTVKIFVSSSNGREQTLRTQGPGTSMGDLAVLDGGNYPASARTSTYANLLFIRREDLQALCMRHAEVGVKLLEVVAACVRPMIGILEQISFSTVRQRLAAHLVHLVQQDRRLTTQGGVVPWGEGEELKLTSSKKDLAAQLGTVPEVISRNLGSLQGSGLIKVRGKSIIICNLKSLKTEAASKN
jgi:CRP/FNR family transcriptional regulator, cyclic AMP receptor protein